MSLLYQKTPSLSSLKLDKDGVSEKNLNNNWLVILSYYKPLIGVTFDKFIHLLLITVGEKGFVWIHASFHFKNIISITVRGKVECRCLTHSGSFVGTELKDIIMTG